MNIYKDLVVLVVGLFWLAINIITHFVVGDVGVGVSNMTFVILVGILVLVKIKSNKFNAWLETPLKK